MNSISELSRWNRFGLFKVKRTTPEPTSPKNIQNLAARPANKSVAGKQNPTPQGRRVKDALNLTIRHQNRCHSPQESSSLSTKCNLPLRMKIRTNYSPNKAEEQNSLSLQRYVSGGKHAEKRPRINYSILQRIRKTLDLYPNITHHMRPCGPKLIAFATQSQDQGKQSSQCNTINLQKLVLFRESKVMRTIERVYEYLMQVQMRGSDSSLHKGDGQIVSLQLELKRYLMQKYKTQKQCKENFINLLYSLYYYSDKFQYEHSLTPNRSKIISKMRSLSIFQKFLSLQYNQDDLIFYLYSRNIFYQLLNCVGQGRREELCFVSGEQLKCFLNVLANGDQCIVRYYEQYLMRYASGNFQGLEVNQILYLLLTNFQEKKSRTQIRPQIAHKLIQRKTPKSTKSSKNETLSCSRINISIDRSFWQTQPPSQQSIDDKLYQILLEEIGVQTKRLVSYFHPQASTFREASAELILIKAIRMLNFVHKMDKYRWFQQMQLVRDKVLIAKAEDFEQIEALQKEIRIIQEDERQGRLERRSVVDLAKRLLTVKAFVDRLEELFEAVENYCLEQH